MVIAGLSLSACNSSSDKLTDAGALADTAPPASEVVNDADSQVPNDADNDAGELLDVFAGLGDSITPGRVLEPLPAEGFTAAPGPDHEPVRAEPATTSVTQFFAVRNPAAFPSDPGGDITDEEFDEGLLPAVITLPADVDPMTNAPPFFVDLDNVEVFAGSELVVVFDPDDPDGGLPGMFSHALLPGASFDDNFNGTKSLRWKPLQPQVGIHEFTVTAIDPLVPQYRATQTIRIRVKLPADTSGIRNLRPGINRIRAHTVQVNDPVVAYIKVTDPNGTIPELQILNPPPGATISAHPFEEAITILHFVPDTPGEVTLELLAIDSEDPMLSTTQNVTIEVLQESDFERPGARLRELASAKDLLFGYAALQSFYERPDGGIYTRIAGEEFNIVSTENSMKFNTLNPVPGDYRWAATDNLVRLAKIQRQTVHAHTLVWYYQVPDWVKRSEPADRELIMREYIDRVMTRYRDDIPLWDVVNESLEPDGTLRRSVWYEGMGADYIDIAFRQARQSAPDATLIYNDYDVAFAGPKSDGLLVLMQELKDAGTPLDGVGFQLHVYADFDKVDEVAATFQKIADMDLDIYVTELDISIGEGQTERQQADLYEQLLSVCLDQPRCKAFQTWGFTDMYSWRRELNPLMFDERYQIKPAYLALQQRLSEN